MFDDIMVLRKIKRKVTASPTTLKLPFSLERASYDSIQYVIVQTSRMKSILFLRQDKVYHEFHFCASLHSLFPDKKFKSSEI